MAGTRRTYVRHSSLKRLYDCGALTMVLAPTALNQIKNPRLNLAGVF